MTLRSEVINDGSEVAAVCRAEEPRTPHLRQFQDRGQLSKPATARCMMTRQAS